jgi:non-heme chloroperoxidase
LTNRRGVLKSVAYGVAAAGVNAFNSVKMQAAGRADGGLPSRVAGSEFIETRDQASLFYRMWGIGRPILFVHSWAVNADLWQYQMIHFAERGFVCVAYDQRGHGRSSDPGKGYEYDTLSDDLATVIERLDLYNATLVGHSMGCGTIVRYLTRRGARRVSRIALISPTLPFILKTDDNPRGVDKSAVEQLHESWKRDFPKWLEDNARPFFVPETSAAMVRWGINMCLQASLKALIDCNRADLETDFRTELASINVPTLIIHGDNDVSAPVDFTGKRTAALIPGSRLIVYEGAPHGLMLTHIDRLNDDLGTFITTGNASVR